MSNPLFNEETYWAPMGRCDRCGQFMKRGLMNWADHLEICRGKPKHIQRSEKEYRWMPTTPAGIKALEEATEAYFENHENNKRG